MKYLIVSSIIEQGLGDAILRDVVLQFIVCKDLYPTLDDILGQRLTNLDLKFNAY